MGNNLPVAIVAATVADALPEYGERMSVLISLLQSATAVADKVGVKEELVPLEIRKALFRAYQEAGFDLADLEGRWLPICSMIENVNKEINKILISEVKAGN